MGFEYDHAYHGGDVKLWRDQHGRAHANVPHAVVIHSPDGFEWGYEGSGPADLAHAILLAAFGRVFADRWYQYFKKKYVAQMPRDGGTIYRHELDAFAEFVTDDERP